MTGRRWYAARYEARYEGGGRFRLRRRPRWPAAGLATAGVVGAGVLFGLWRRVVAWAGHGAHSHAGTVVVAVLLAALVWWVWRRTG